MTEELLFEILRQLTVILQAIHWVVFADNDLKNGSVALEFSRDSVRATLLYVGNILPIGKAVDIDIHIKYSVEYLLHAYSCPCVYI